MTNYFCEENILIISGKKIHNIDEFLIYLQKFSDESRRVILKGLSECYNPIWLYEYNTQRIIDAKNKKS